MRFRNVVTAVVVALVSSQVALAQGDMAAFKTFVNGFNAKAAKAFESKDQKFFETCSTSDFTYVNHQGKSENKKASMESMKQMFGMAKSIKCVSATPKNHRATKGMMACDMKDVYTMVMPGEKGKDSKIVMTSYTTAYFKKSGSTWKVCKIVETKKGDMTVDGKKVDPDVMMGGGGH